MAFEILSPAQKQVAEAVLLHLKRKHGSGGLKTDVQLLENVNWQPTFYFRLPSLIVAVEVTEIVFPQILKITLPDLMAARVPIVVYSACPLDVYLTDSKQHGRRGLEERGFGLLTADTAGVVSEQLPPVPLAQHISEETVRVGTEGFPPKLRAAFVAARDTFRADGVQGVQRTGQIIEGIIRRAAAQAIQKAWVNLKDWRKGDLADVIDELYKTKQCQAARAALGAARSFAKEFRNISSHPPGSRREAIERQFKMRDGFMEAMKVCGKLREGLGAVNLKVVTPDL